MSIPTLKHRLAEMPKERREAIEAEAERLIEAAIAEGIASGPLSELDDINTIIANAEAEIAAERR